jgi:NDP-sugar pyrophosphorylase family protein
MKAVILAGGEGRRLRPYTLTVPKPMVPILNKPLLEYTIDLLKSQGIRDIVITTCYKADTIRSHFQDGRGHGVSITYLEEPFPLGTAGGLFRARVRFKEPILIMSGDAFTDLKLQDVISYHFRRKARMTMVTKEVNDPAGYGVCHTDSMGRLIEFREKPENWLGDEVNTGIYVMDPLLLDEYHREGQVDFSKDLIPELLASNERVFAYRTNAYWRDIGSPDQYKHAREDVMAGTIAAPFLSDLSMKGEPFMTKIRVSCPKKKKPIVFAKLMETVPSFWSSGEVVFRDQGGGRTKIINDPERGFIIYSKAQRKQQSKKLAEYYGDKIKNMAKGVEEYE